MFINKKLDILINVNSKLDKKVLVNLSMELLEEV